MTQRKFVRPSIEGAAIPDPDRARDLPLSGQEVEWTPYWAAVAERGDITVSDLEQPIASVDAEPASKKKSQPAGQNSRPLT